MERPAEQAPIERLACPHVRAVGLDPAAQRDVVVCERGDQQRDLVRGRRHVRVREEHEVRVRGEHPGADRRALSAVGTGAGRGAAGRASREPPRVATARAPPSRPCSRRRRRGPGVRSAARRRRVRRPGPRSRAGQVAEELVERRPEARLLVVGGQDDRERGGVASRGVYRRRGASGTRSVARIVINM